MSTATIARPEFDVVRAQEFGMATIQTVVEAHKSLLLSVGHQTGLFDAMAKLAPATSAEVASAAKLNERYVREWLNGCVTGRIIDFDPDTRTYFLPPEHAASLTRASGTGNYAAYAQYSSLLGGVEQQVIEAFRNGGGVPYSEVPGFHRIHGEVSASRYDEGLVDRVIPLAPGLRARLEDGISVADIGCGSGYALCVLAEAFPNSRFTGYDFEEIALDRARTEAKRRGVINVEFIALDVTEFDATEVFDLITAFDAIHDQAKPATVLRNVQRAIKKDGTFLVADIAGSSFVEKNMQHPLAPMLYATSLYHCMTVSLAQDGAGLGTMWGEELALQMFEDAGFANVAKHSVEGDIVNVYYVCTK